MDSNKTFTLPATRTEQVEVEVSEEALTKLVESGQFSFNTLLSGLESQYLKSIDMRANCYIDDNNDMWEQSNSWDYSEPHQIRPSTEIEREMMGLFRQIRHNRYAHRLIGEKKAE